MLFGSFHLGWLLLGLASWETAELGWKEAVSEIPNSAPSFTLIKKIVQFCDSTAGCFEATRTLLMSCQMGNFDQN